MSWKLKNLRMVMESLQGRDVQLDSYLVDTEKHFIILKCFSVSTILERFPLIKFLSLKSQVHDEMIVFHLFWDV